MTEEQKSTLAELSKAYYQIIRKRLKDEKTKLQDLVEINDRFNKFFKLTLDELK